MHCPICSTRISVDQKFCRKCGFGLEKIAEAVSEQHPMELAQNLEAQSNKFERLGVIALYIFGLGVIGFFLYIFGHKVMLLVAQGKTVGAVALIALTVILLCGLLSVILFAKAKEVQDNSTKRPSRHSKNPLDSAASTKLFLEDTIEPIPSVTERTTEWLPAEKRKSQ